VASLVSRYAEVRSREWERGNYALLAVALLSIAVFGLTVAGIYLLMMLREKQVAFIFSARTIEELPDLPPPGGEDSVEFDPLELE
jgi:hypothetical protein